MNECLTTPEHKNKLNKWNLHTKLKSNMYILKIHKIIKTVKSCTKFVYDRNIK